MADTWIGLCNDETRADLARALRHVDAQARILFVSSPEDMRGRIREAPFRYGAIVGPYSGEVSPINVAAMLVRDAMAADVALVVHALSAGIEKRASQAGIRTVIDLSSLPSSHIDDLDEPELVDDDVPTMVLGTMSTAGVSASSVPQVEKPRRCDAQDVRAKDVITIPLVREGRNGPELQSVTIPRGPTVAEEERNRVASAKKMAASERKAPIITFVSGRGGVGKTSLVAMCAVIADSWGMRVALCDLDLSCGNLYSFFEYGAPVDLPDLLEAGKCPPEALLAAGRHLTDNVSLWGPCELPETAETVHEGVEDMLNTLAQNHDLVLVDTSTTFTDAVAQAAQQCDRLVITVDERPGAAVSQARVAALAVRLGVARTRLVRLANRCGPHGKGEVHINRAEVGLETARPMRVLDGGGEVAECMAEGKAGDLIELGSRFAQSCAFVLATLLQELGCVPDTSEAHRALEWRDERPRWSFAHRREAM